MKYWVLYSVIIIDTNIPYFWYSYWSFSYIYILVCVVWFVLNRTGLGQLFNDSALAISGHTAGGPAKVAVLSSGFLGSINGSAIANVVTTGSFTIPLMKRSGYSKNFAGAVEAAASIEGQILPPVMGAAAFIMAETLGMPYKDIAIVAILPGILYYMGVITVVHPDFNFCITHPFSPNKQYSPPPLQYKRQ